MMFDSPPALGGGAVLEGRAAPAWAPVPKPAPGMAASAPRRWPVVGVAAVVGVGMAERVWVAVHPLGTLTSDGSVVGLMAMQLLHHGQLSAYMWGQSYGGSLEAVLTAVVFAVTGTGDRPAPGGVRPGQRPGRLGAVVRRSAHRGRPCRPPRCPGLVGVAAVLRVALAQAGGHVHGGPGAVAVRPGGLGPPAQRGRAVAPHDVDGRALWPGFLVQPDVAPDHGAGRPVVWAGVVACPAPRTALLCGAAVGAFPAIVFGATHGWSNVAVPGGTGLPRGCLTGWCSSSPPRDPSPSAPASRAR